MARTRALITGFEPYGGRGLNPAAEVANRLDGEVLGGVDVVGRTFPVSYQSLRANVEQAIDEVDPALVIAFGLWPGQPMIRLERVALNLADFDIDDNDGLLLSDQPLVAGGATARLATLPLRAIERALLDAGIPVEVSNTAGTFLCNAVLYAALDVLEARGTAVPCGFIHLPYLPAQVAGLITEGKESRAIELQQRADIASMALETMVAAARIALDVALAEAEARS